MRTTRALAATTALVLLTAACGGGDEAVEAVAPATPPSAAAAAPAAAAPTRSLAAAEVESALLTQADVPSTYTIKPAAAEAAEPAPADPCAARFSALSKGDHTDGGASAKVEFTESMGIGLQHGVESHRDAAGAQRRLAEVRSVVADCATFTDTILTGDQVDFRVQPLSFPRLGDDTVALAVTGTTPQFNLAFNLVIVADGANVLSVGQGGLTADAALLQRLTRTAHAKVVKAAS